MMSDKELKEMGFTREEWDKLVEEERLYTESWADKVRGKIK